MARKQRKPSNTTLIAGLIGGSVALATLPTTGCDRASAESLAALTSDSSDISANPLIATVKLDLRNKLAANHNETFLVCTSA